MPGSQPHAVRVSTTIEVSRKNADRLKALSRHLKETRGPSYTKRRVSDAILDAGLQSYEATLYGVKS